MLGSCQFTKARLCGRTKAHPNLPDTGLVAVSAATKQQELLIVGPHMITHTLAIRQPLPIHISDFISRDSTGYASNAILNFGCRSPTRLRNYTTNMCRHRYSSSAASASGYIIQAIRRRARLSAHAMTISRTHRLKTRPMCSAGGPRTSV